MPKNPLEYGHVSTLKKSDLPDQLLPATKQLTYDTLVQEEVPDLTPEKSPVEKSRR
jgi:hypothetical protein